MFSLDTVHVQYISMYCKTPVTPSGVSTALSRSSLIFRNAVRSQEISNVFLKKRLPRRPRSVQGVATELLWRPIAFLRSSCWRFYALSRRVHCAFTVLTLRALCCHGVRTVLSRRLHYADGVASQKVCKYQEL